MSQIVINGNNIDILKTYPDNYFDAVVTDPPYGLGKEPNAAELMKDWIEFGYHEIKGTGFMGKEWDAFVPQPIFWKEVFRVLKHGGHVLSFFGTRTYDWGVMSMRFAGFEVRDCIQWLYGSGFPKSHNIGKAIDKIQGNHREAVDYKYQNRNPNGKNGISLSGDDNLQIRKIDGDTKGNSEWEGWGTALKPAHEPIVMARKPLSEKSIAENVLKHGTGGINIDGSRIGFNNENIDLNKKLPIQDGGTIFGGGKGFYRTEEITEYKEGGRFPANIIFDEEAGQLLDEQSGVLKSGQLKSESYTKERDNNSIFGGGGNFIHKGYSADKGGASRFFYVAKASKSERNKGLDEFEAKRSSAYGYEIGLGEKGEGMFKDRNPIKQNFHPTVKPIKLMQYLVKMITPPNGIVLDPFCGSGTTGVACKIEGFDFVGMEQDPEYYKIAQSRINNYIESPDDYEEGIENKIQIVKKNIKPQLTLF